MPRAYLGTQLAADTNRQVDSTDTHGIPGISRIRDFVDAINRANRDTRVTSGAEILVEDSELLGKFLFLGH